MKIPEDCQQSAEHLEGMTLDEPELSQNHSLPFYTDDEELPAFPKMVSQIPSPTMVRTSTSSPMAFSMSLSRAISFEHLSDAVHANISDVVSVSPAIPEFKLPELDRSCLNLPNDFKASVDFLTYMKLDEPDIRQNHNLGFTYDGEFPTFAERLFDH